MNRYILLIVTTILLTLSNSAYGQQDSVAMSVNVEQVTITGDKRIVSEADRYGNVLINTKQLFSMPRVAGAVDIVRALQFSPGVIAPSDGDTSIYVRGGDAGQNLTLLNNAPVYSPAHLFGFFSVFNTAHLGGATFVKSSMPAKYGSALSSVLDIRPHSYIPPKFGMEGNIGLIESDLALQIPMGKNSALYLSARHSYISWLVAVLMHVDMTMSYEFEDYGLTYVKNLGKAGKLVFNSHYNRDRLLGDLSLYDSMADVRWWNNTNSVVVTTPFDNGVKMENTIYGTHYSNRFDVDLIGNNFAVPTALVDIGYKNNVEWKRNKIELNGGADYAYRRVQPQGITSTLSTNEGKTIIQHTHEAGIYASVLYKPFKRLELDGGIRLSLYSVDGKEYFNPEPRILVAVPLSQNVRLWASYNTTVQYLQLVPQSNASFATDFYVGSTDKHPPMKSYNSSLGYSQSVLSGGLRWSVEMFYRQMYNVLEFDTRLNTMLSTNYDINDYIYSGIGEAYGAEFMLSYSHPKFDMQAHYTLSRSLRQFRELNNGKPFASSADRRHNLSFTAGYKPTEQWNISTTFVYATGGAYTAPTAIDIIGGAFLKEYGAYNGARMPDYHRMDISITYWFKSKRFQRNGINLSVYNVYLKRNPIILSWQVIELEDQEGAYEIKQSTPALFEILPSISWTFKF